MVTTSPTSQAPATGTTTGTNAGTRSPRAQTDYLTFLNMLTVQMQNQDPFNPMDASDFAVQLATFSSVEQQTQTNNLLQSMLRQSGLSDLSGWVGMEARLFSGAYFTGTPVELAPEPAQGADQVILTVRNSDGDVVDTRELSTEGGVSFWDGRREDGSTLPEGQYRFQIESRLNGDTLDTQPVAAYVRVLEARMDEGATMLVLPGGQLVNADTVTGLRRPADAA